MPEQETELGAAFNLSVRDVFAWSLHEDIEPLLLSCTAPHTSHIAVNVHSCTTVVLLYMKLLN